MAQAIRKVVTRLLNGYIAPYTENLSENDLQFSLVSGSLALNNLQIKRGALDSLNLPIEVEQGLIGQLHIYVPLTTLGSEPIRLVIQDVFLLVKMKQVSGDIDSAEEEKKLQKVKQDQLKQLEAKESAAREASAAEKQGQQKQGWMDWLGVSSLTEKAVNNVQISIKNIHVRYEDDTSTPGHPFAAGITLASFEVVSADENWVEGFIKQVFDATRKVARMDSLSVYVDSDTESITRSGFDSIDMWKSFQQMISRKDQEAEHQYVVRPITGDARVILRKRPSAENAKMDVNIAFDEIGIVLEDGQWRDASGVIELFHYYQRTSQYRKYRPSIQELQENRGKARWKLAKAIMHEIHEKKRRWTWEYMAQRRDDRKTYVELYSRTLQANKPLAGEDLEIIAKLELDLSYEDIRWFRKLAKRKAREDRTSRKRTEEPKPVEQDDQPKVPGGWLNWVWGSGQNTAAAGTEGMDDQLTEADRQEVTTLFEDDEDELDVSELSPDTVLRRIDATLGKGSFALRSSKYGRDHNMIALVFDQLSAKVFQLPSTLDATVALGGFSVSDGITPNTLHPQIVRVKEQASITQITEGDNPLKQQNDPFFVVRYEQNPLDQRADIGISAKMRHLEIVYSRGYIEAVSAFFRNASELESVNALIAAAGQSFEGLRQGTRAGLEYALERHKTMDVQIDMDAPIIIVPERMDSLDSLHLVLDAGHIAVESALANQKEVQDIQSKRGQVLVDEDYVKLQSLMYDKFSLRLESTQLLIGNSWDSCMAALEDQVGGSSKLHIVEKIGMDFMIQNAILDVPQLTKLKVSGHLPNLHVNLSDTKYKSLMRLIDIAVPRSNPEENLDATQSRAYTPLQPNHDFHLIGESHDFDDNASFLTDETDIRREEDGTFHDAVDDTANNQNLQFKQKTFELEFTVGELRASLSRSVTNGEDHRLATAALNGFALDLAIRQYDMSVNLGLKTLSLDMLQSEKISQPVIVTLLEEEDELVRVKYARVNKESPEFMSLYDGIDQSIDTSISTLKIHIEPEPLISLYDFIMTTFVPDRVEAENQEAAVNQEGDSSDKLRIRVRLRGVQLLLVNDSRQFATLALTTADVALLLRGGTMRLGATLGNISFRDEMSTDQSQYYERDILTIEGNDLANLTYETFDPTDLETFPGYNSFVKLRSGSLRLFVSPQPLQYLVAFLTKLARLKAVYDTASQAAMQKAAEVVRMRYDIEVKTPILVLPRLDQDNKPENERVIVRLGQVSAKNEYYKDRPSASAIDASLTGISIASESLVIKENMPILADVDLRARIEQSGSDETQSDVSSSYGTKIIGNSNDIVMTLTQSQYRLVMALLRDLPSMLSEMKENGEESSPASSVTENTLSNASSSNSSLENVPSTSTMEVKFDVPTVRLELFDAKAITRATLKGHSIIRFEIEDVATLYQQGASGEQLADVRLAAITLSNTRPGASLYRDFLPKSTSKEGQIHLKYEAGGGKDAISNLALNINGPQFILAADPLYALMDFAVLDEDEDDMEEGGIDAIVASPDVPPVAAKKPENNMSIQLTVSDASVLLLASDSVKNTGLIELRIAQMVLTKQHNLTMAVQKLGMFFGHMDDPTDRARFLDDVNITLGYSAQGEGGASGTHIALGIQTIIFRASYGDLLLITDVANKAIALASRQNPQIANEELGDESLKQRRASKSARRSTVTRRPEIQGPVVKPKPNGPKLTKLSTELLDASFGGFQLVLIGDIHELPVVHLQTPAFSCKAKDWSADLNASVTFKPSINYYNLKNSHWEPLLDPWEFGITAKTKTYPNGSKNTAVSLYSDRRLEMNMTAAFIELAITSVTLQARTEEKKRQGIETLNAPFVVRNLTGRSILVRNDLGYDSRQKSTTKARSQRLADGESIPWRFQDPKQQRENISAASRNAFAVTIENMHWDEIRGISVEREGEFLFMLSPQIQEFRYHLASEISLRDNVKVITFRSTFVIENETHLPLEAKLLDSANKLSRATYNIQPGDKWPIPLESVVHSRVIVRPIGGYSWPSTAFGWRDLMRNPVRALTCKHESDQEAPFRCQAAAIYDKKDPLTRAYPRMKLRIRAPVEIENLLPYNIRYRVYDKHLGTNTTNFLIKGGVSPIHTVNLSHLLMLSVLVQDSGFKQSDFAIINTDDPDDFRTEKEILLRDNRNAELKLKLHYYKYPDSGGAFKVILYSPYVIINKTGLPFDMAYKSWSGGMGDLPGRDRFRNDYRNEIPTPFMFSYPKEDRGNRMFIRVEDSEWSEPVSFEGVAADSQIKVTGDKGRTEYQIGMSYTEGMGKYKLSKAITLAPRYVIVNNYRKTLQVRQHRTENYRTVAAGEKVFWHAFKKTASEQLSLGLAGSGTRWSAPIDIANVGKTFLLLPQLNGSGNPSLLRIECRLQDATIFLFIYEETEQWPIQLRNETNIRMKFRQTEDATYSPPPQDRQYEDLPGFSTIPFSWDYPSAKDKKIKLAVGGNERDIDVMEIGILPPWKLSRQNPNTGATGVLSLDVRTEGQSQVLVITRYDAENSIYKPTRPAAQRTDSVDGSNSIAFETIESQEKPTLTLEVKLEGVGLSIVNKNLQELMYLSFRGLKLAYNNYATSYDASLDCGWIQIDNQLFGGLYPIILYPTIQPKDSKELEARPTLQASVTILRDDQHGVMYIKYASILLQMITIELDEDFLFALYDFSKFENASWEEPIPDVLFTNPAELPEPLPVPPGTNIYFELLALQPTQIDISFMRTERVNVDKKPSTRNPLVFFLNALTMALGNINGAPLRLNALFLENARVTWPTLQERLVLHYQEQIISQLYRVLGSADFLGNPVGLLNNVSSGFTDIFYEPYQGIVMHGGKELGVGLARGASSFAKKLTYGFSDSFSKVTGSIGKGISAAALDSEWQARRRMTLRRNKPKHALYGITNGANVFASSVASGFEGLALKPLEGAEAGGVGGFFKGVGKGFVGAIAKPVAGVFDFASNVSEGIRNTTTVFDAEGLDRARYPRFCGSNGVLEPFDVVKATGQFWLKDLEHGKFFNETYVAHVHLNREDSAIIVTKTRILCIILSKMQLRWEIPFEDLKTIIMDTGGIGLVMQDDVNGPFIPLPEKAQKAFLFKALSNVIKAHNNERELANIAQGNGRSY